MVVYLYEVTEITKLFSHVSRWSAQIPTGIITRMRNLLIASEPASSMRRNMLAERNGFVYILYADFLQIMCNNEALYSVAEVKDYYYYYYYWI
jgi:hypothetical protein